MEFVIDENGKTLQLAKKTLESCADHSSGGDGEIALEGRWIREVTKPIFQMISRAEMESIHHAAMGILERAGLMVEDVESLRLLSGLGADVDLDKKIAKIPEYIVKEALEKAPRTVRLYSRDGKHDVLLENNNVYFCPGSVALEIVDHEGEVRRPQSRDLRDFVKLIDALENIHIQSLSTYLWDVPKSIVKAYGLYIALKYTTKPILTAAFTKEGPTYMRRLLESVGGEDFAKRPIAFGVVSTASPLYWGELSICNLKDYARYVPVLIWPMPMSGATSPATLAGSLVQHTVECLSGVVMAHFTSPNTPIFYGGSTAIFDMRTGRAASGAIETAMMGCAHAQMGKYYGLPTHAGIGWSEAKVVDAQSGFESAIGLILGALSGINVICSSGMLNSITSQSFEKIVIDNELCGMAYRLVRGIDVNELTLARDLIAEVGPKGHFLTREHTLEWFKREQFIPSPIIDRYRRKQWESKGMKDVVKRAKEMAEEILAKHVPEPLPPDIEKDLDNVMKDIAIKYGIKKLPTF